jgi:hypothetical protein
MDFKGYYQVVRKPWYGEAAFPDGADPRSWKNSNPILNKREHRTADEGAERSNGCPPGWLKKKIQTHILIIDDEEDLCWLLARMR